MTLHNYSAQIEALAIICNGIKFHELSLLFISGQPSSTRYCSRFFCLQALFFGTLTPFSSAAFIIMNSSDMIPQLNINITTFILVDQAYPTCRTKMRASYGFEKLLSCCDRSSSTLTSLPETSG